MLTRSSAYARLAPTRRAVVMMRMMVRGVSELHVLNLTLAFVGSQIAILPRRLLVALRSARLLIVTRPVAAMNVDRRLATRTGGESAEQLSVAHHELGSAAVIVALGAAVALSPCGRRADLRMLAFRSSCSRLFRGSFAMIDLVLCRGSAPQSLRHTWRAARACASVRERAREGY